MKISANAILIAVLLIPSISSCDGASFLTPGLIGQQCGSFLTPGQFKACEKKVKKVTTKPTVKTQAQQRQSLSTRLKNFYAHYGKPPVAAAKALLDPTPQNIDAWALEEVRNQDNAAMVAAELTAAEKRIEKKAQNVPEAELMSAKIPTYYADDMKITFWARTKDCPDCEQMTHEMQALAVENPSMIIQEKLVGAGSLEDAINYAANSGLDFEIFPSTKKEALAAGVHSVPSLTLDDLEYHRFFSIQQPVTLAQLRQTIIDFRAFNIRHPATGKRGS